MMSGPNPESTTCSLYARMCTCAVEQQKRVMHLQHEVTVLESRLTSAQATAATVADTLVVLVDVLSSTNLVRKAFGVPCVHQVSSLVPESTLSSTYGHPQNTWTCS
jgi:hypothetical protein